MPKTATRVSPLIVPPRRGDGRVPPGFPRFAVAPARAVHVAEVRDDDAREEERADDDVLILSRDQVCGHRRLERAEDGDGEDDADDRAAATEDRDAAEQDDGDDQSSMPMPES